jgi:hypothetical protein
MVLKRLLDVLKPKYCVHPSTTKGHTSRTNAIVIVKASKLKIRKRGIERMAEIRNSG